MNGNFDTHKWFKNQYLNEDEDTDLCFTSCETEAGDDLRVFLLQHLNPATDLDTLGYLIDEYLDAAVEDQQNHYDY
jgi:hypothetical protein